MSISELLQMLKTDINSMSMGEKILGGVYTALLAMGVVFIVLALIMFIIKVINITPIDKNVDKVSNSSDIANVQENQTSNELNDDIELVSVITAAIMASSSKNIVVRRITRTNNIQSNWEKTSNIEV